MWGHKKYLDEKFKGLAAQMTHVEEKIDEHIDWHNGVYLKITKGSLKFVGYAFAGVCFLVVIIGVKDGSLMSMLFGFIK